jgi:hypothetical protein
MIQERIKKSYKRAKLPFVYIPENRGLIECCEPLLVLANGDGISYHNDIEPAWLKLTDDPTDTVDFVLKKNGIDSVYQPTPQAFINEPNAFFIQVPWSDVLASDGLGMYTIEISYSISGITSSFTWGMYDLQLYTPANSDGTVRLKAVFNVYHEIEDINFLDSNVTGTLRLKGFCGNRKLNMKIENNWLNNRSLDNIVKENIPSYEFTTDPLRECKMRRLTDLYLLSSVDLFVSDYNSFNHTYAINDLPVGFEESPETVPYEFSRYQGLTVNLIDARRNKRTYYR